MSNDVTSVFDAHANDYDAARRRLVPFFDAFYGTAVEALALGVRAPARILDLGAGTGLLAARVGAAYPAAHLTLADGAAAMLALARARLGDIGVAYVEHDLGDALPDGPWDAVVSALAIHHLADEDKRALMRRIAEALPPGGVFVNAEQVSAPSPTFAAAYESWHEAQARAAGCDDAELAAARARMAHDRCAPVEDQLGWLREAGFAEADCPFKAHMLAVMVAIR